MRRREINRGGDNRFAILVQSRRSLSLGRRVVPSIDRASHIIRLNALPSTVELENPDGNAHDP
jgi:hypothetical protein